MKAIRAAFDHAISPLFGANDIRTQNLWANFVQALGDNLVAELQRCYAAHDWTKLWLLIDDMKRGAR